MGRKIIKIIALLFTAGIVNCIKMKFEKHDLLWQSNEEEGPNSKEVLRTYVDIENHVIETIPATSKGLRSVHICDMNITLYLDESEKICYAESSAVNFTEALAFIRGHADQILEDKLPRELYPIKKNLWLPQVYRMSLKWCDNFDLVSIGQKDGAEIITDADQIRVKRQTLEDQPSSSWFQRRHRYRRYRARDSQGHSRGACGDEAAAGGCRDHATHDAANRGVQQAHNRESAFQSGSDNSAQYQYGSHSGRQTHSGTGSRSQPRQRDSSSYQYRDSYVAQTSDPRGESRRSNQARVATGPLRVDSHRFGAPGSVGGLDNAAVGAQTPVQSVKHDGYNYYQEQRMQEYVASRGNAQQHTGTNFVDTHRFGAPGTASGLVNAAGAPTTSRQGQAHGRGSTYRAPQSAPVNKISRKQEQLDFVDKHRFGAPGTVGGLDTTAGETQGQQGRQQQQQHERDFVDMDYELAWSTREQVQQGQGSNINGYRSSEGHNSQISRQRNSQQAAAENTNQRAYQEHDARDIRYNSNGPGQGGSSQAQSQVNLGVGETMASSSSGGSGATQTQVQGSVTGSGSFSANSQSSGGGGQYASSSVQGNQDGASGQAGGGLNARGSQAQVTLSRSGAGTAGSQSNFYQGGSTSNVQAGLNGGRSSSQATGLGLTNSRANIGFSENSPVTSGAPYHGGGQASAQSHGGHGQSQSQLHGRFNNGRTYSGSAQAGSGTRDAYQSQARNYNDQPNIDTRERARSSHYANYEGAQTNNVGQQSRDREIQPHQRGNEMHQTFDEDRRRHHVTSQINEVIPPQRSRSQIGAQSNPASNIQYERNDAHNSRLYHAGEDIPGFPGFEVPEGFRARVVTPETSKFYSAARGQSRAGQSIDQGAGSNVYEARLSSAAAHDTSTDASDVVEEEYYDEEYYNSDEYYSYDEDDEADFEATEGTPGSTSNQAPAGGRATDGVDQQHSQGYSPPVQVSQGAVYDALTPTPVTTTSTTTVRTEGQGDRAYSRNAHFAQGRGGNSETEARFTGSPATPSGTRAQPRNRCSTCYPISGTVSLRGDIWQFVSPQLKVNYGGSAMSQQGGQVDVRSQGGNQDYTMGSSGRNEETLGPQQQVVIGSQSSSCGYYTFSCHIVLGSSRKTKICRPASAQC